MPDGPRQNRSLHPPSDDWFSPIVAVSGGVLQCLNSVESDLNAKVHFTRALKNALGHCDETQLDRISSLFRVVRQVEAAVHFRVSQLDPTRTASWFRASVTNTGPFSSALIDAPVFLPCEEKSEHIELKLKKCWLNASTQDFPFDKSQDSLWLLILRSKIELTSINILDSTYGMTIENCLEVLPTSLESRYLRAFLMNVRGEFLALRELLEEVYNSLLRYCQRFWTEQAKVQSARRSHKSGQNTRVENIRNSFRKRREASSRSTIYTRGEQDALNFMGFASYPDIDELKRRYLSLAKSLHPDRNQGQEQDFKVLTRSYELLLSRLSSWSHKDG